VVETVTPFEPTVVALFDRAVARWADSVAFRTRRTRVRGAAPASQGTDADAQWQSQTFTEYGKAVREVGAGLAASGLDPGDFGAIMSGNRPEWHVADLGMVTTGLVSCPIYPTSSPPQVAYILEHSEARVIVVSDEAQRAKVEAVRKDLPALRMCVVMDGPAGDDDFWVSWEDLRARGAAHLEQQAEAYAQRRRAAAADPDRLMAVIYTSGTTGPPKGTMISHRNAVWTLESLHQVMEAGPQDRKLSFLPLSHVGERMSTAYLQVRQGFEVWFNESIDTLREDLAATRPTVQFVVPRILEKQYEGVRSLIAGLPDDQRTMAERALELGVARVRAQQRGESLPPEAEAAYASADERLFSMARTALGYGENRVVVSGAAPIAKQLLEFFNAIGVRTYEVYGQTEGNGPTTINRLDRYKLGTVGYAIPGVEVRTADDGEVLFRGGNVCMGYYKDPKATAELLDADGWLHTGDVGELDDDGFLTITDRKKDLIITATGKNVAPQVIEQKLKFSPWISQAVVIGDRRRFVTALLTLDETAVRTFAEQKSIVFSSLEDLSRHPDIVGLVEVHVAEVNAQLSGAESVKRFQILPEDFSVASNTITPTLKIKRKPIAQRYGDLIEQMYAEA